ncbi:MAG: VUT family protein, partial [Neisseriaceae bacterium]
MLPKLQKKFSTQRHAFKLYTSLSVLFIILQIECILSVHKQISIFNVDLTISGIIYPFNLLILGIITNSYGYQYARQLLWLNNLALIQFIIYNFIIFHLNPSLAMQIHQPDLVQSYNILVPLYIKSSISSMVSENIANFIFIWMINISKILQHGKKIGWRIMKYSVLANFIMLIIAYSVIFFNRYTVLH